MDKLPLPQKITVENFCIGLSSTDKRVEMIAAFHHEEVVAKRMHDTQERYQSRFEEFVTKPA